MRYFYTTLLLLCITQYNIAQQVINSSLTHNGLTRNYILFIPGSYDPATPAPLVFSFHGYSSNAALNMNYTGFTAISDTAGFILVHPDGTLDASGTPHWNVGGWTIGSTVDDIGFADQIITEISNNYNINTDRIYSTGMSNGGYMSFLLACQLSDKIAAIASVTGSMTPQTYSACNPSHPTPVLQIHGTMDGTVPYEGDPTWTYSIEDVMNYWVNYNNCNTTPTLNSIPDINTNDGSTVDHFIFDGGSNGVTTEHFKVYGGDHDWPGVWGNMDINASLEVWKFFSQYDMNGSILAVNDLSENKTVEIFPNPANENITISHSFGVNTPFDIMDVSGKIIYSDVLTKPNQVVDVSTLTSGIYWFSSKEMKSKIVVQ